MAFRADLSTFGILTMAKYCAFLSRVTNAERWKSSHVVDDAYLPNSPRRFSYVKIHEREKGGGFENIFNCETNATEHLSHGHLKTCLFFLNLIQLSQSLTSYLFVRVNLKFGNFKKIFNEFISGNRKKFSRDT